MKTGQENINYSGRCTATNENIKNNGMTTPTYKRTTDKNYANQKPEAKCTACTWLENRSNNSLN